VLIADCLFVVNGFAFPITRCPDHRITRSIPSSRFRFSDFGDDVRCWR